MHRIQKTILLAILLILTPIAQAASTELDQGYNNLYNADFPAAHTNFRNWMQAHPEDPLGPASDAAAFLFSEFHRLNIIEIELFKDPTAQPNVSTPKDPNLRANFDNRTQQAEKLADAILAKSPKDTSALFAKMLIDGLRADYAEMIDKSDLKALRYSEKGADYSAQTLQTDPKLYDAHIATGFENYMLSLKPMPVRFFARLMGGQTDKATGISELKITAQHGHYLAPFAQILLSVAELREGNNAEAKAILTTLTQQFPRNALYARQLNRIH